MSVRQYIGARYVPIFFDNNGSSEWVANHAYEPLTIVTYLGNSYTSKKLVTPDIGNPASNSEYWASTGIYNSQVEQYRQEVQGVIDDVEDLNDDVASLTTRMGTAEGNITSQGTRLTAAENDIDALQTGFANLSNRKIIFLGDSLGTGTGGGIEVTPWPTLVGQHLGLSQNSSYWNFSRGSRAFGYNGGNESNPDTGRNWCDGLRKAINTLTAEQRASITDIVIGGSINDYEFDNTAIENGITNFSNLAKANFPNAKVLFCNIVGSAVYNYKYNYYHAANLSIFRSCGAHGISYKRCDWGLLSILAYFPEDGVHPLQSGQNDIARRIAIAILGGDSNATGISNAMPGSLINFATFFDGEKYNVRCAASEITFDGTFTINSSWNKIDSFNAVSFTGRNTNVVSTGEWAFTIPCTIRTASGYTNNVMLEFVFRQNSENKFLVDLYCRNRSHITGIAFTTFEAISMWINDFQVDIPFLFV